MSSHVIECPIDCHEDVCPHCGTAALISLGTRIDHPRAWLPWTTTVTEIFYCGACAAVCEGSEAPTRRSAA
jgi:hypothetical protein